MYTYIRFFPSTHSSKEPYIRRAKKRMPEMETLPFGVDSFDYFDSDLLLDKTSVFPKGEYNTSKTYFPRGEILNLTEVISLYPQEKSIIEQLQTNNHYYVIANRFHQLILIQDLDKIEFIR